MDKVTTIGLADRIKSLIGKDSNYALAKYLSLSQTAVCHWYHSGVVMADSTAVQVAELLKLDPEMVLLWLQVERAERKGNDILSQHWRHIAEQIAA